MGDVAATEIEVVRTLCYVPQAFDGYWPRRVRTLDGLFVRFSSKIMFPGNISILIVNL